MEKQLASKIFILSDYTSKENMEEQILEPTIFEIYKDKKLYSIVKVRKGI